MTKAYSYIRMSTDAQLNGDSLRRQIEKTRQFATRHGLLLDENFELKDIGLSAYDGSNLAKGELGKFLLAVNQGAIENGSYLIVESFDRLSRQHVRQSLRLFLDLLDHGICVATLIDERIYRPESTDQMELMMSLMLMSRAYDESLHKSERVAAAWSQKRKLAGSKVLTARCKAWLKLKADRTGFDVIPERANIVQRIFDEAADQGIGADSIARRLNRERASTFGRSKGWHKSYILKILADKAVLGEFQPHKMTSGGRTPVGEPFKDYYPRVIEDGRFYRAQAALARRKISGGGRKGERVSNLFSKLARCGVCGARLTFVNKGRRGGTSLVCDTARRGLGCYPIGWRYDDFERSFLTFIREVDLPGIAGDFAEAHALISEREKLVELEGRLQEAQRRRAVTLDLILGDEPTDFLRGRLRELDGTVATLTMARDELRASTAAAEQEAVAFHTGAETIGPTIDRLQAETSDEMYRARSTVAAKLADIVSELIVWPFGKPTSEAAITLIQQAARDKFGAELHDVEQYVTRPDRVHRAFFVRFKDGRFRFVAPSLDDPSTVRSYQESPNSEVL